ncbi:hypothetical protein DFH27DRAFT_524208 [Peziza echinospora]|nr:hypothetical protein DFH27DRAFT_524208 [Peziza echinospora]
MSSFGYNPRAPIFNPVLANANTYIDGYTSSVLNPDAPSFVPGSMPVERDISENGVSSSTSIPNDFPDTQQDPQYHNRLACLIHRTDISYPPEFNIDPNRVRVGPPPHVACLRHNVEVQLSRLTQSFTYTPLNDLSEERREEIRRVWDIQQTEIDAMDMAYKQRGPRPRLPQETRHMLWKLWAPPDSVQVINNDTTDSASDKIWGEMTAEDMDLSMRTEDVNDVPSSRTTEEVTSEPRNASMANHGSTDGGPAAPNSQPPQRQGSPNQFPAAESVNSTHEGEVKDNIHSTSVKMSPTEAVQTMDVNTTAADTTTEVTNDRTDVRPRPTIHQQPARHIDVWTTETPQRPPRGAMRGRRGGRWSRRYRGSRF